MKTPSKPRKMYATRYVSCNNSGTGQWDCDGSFKLRIVVGESTPEGGWGLCESCSLRKYNAGGYKK